MVLIGYLQHWHPSLFRLYHCLPLYRHGFFSGRGFTITNYFGLLISVAGVVLVIMGESNAKPTAMAGVLLMLLAVFSAVCHSVFVRKLSEHYNTFTIVTYQSTVGLIYFIPFFAIYGFSRLHAHPSHVGNGYAGC